MDTSLYRYVIAAAEAGSFSAAARNLYISQPALTKQIGKLEERQGKQASLKDTLQELRQETAPRQLGKKEKQKAAIR